jgi:YegS/Rv2252/BmrU family lipid kinase
MVRFATMAGQTETDIRRATLLVNPVARRVRGHFDGEAAARYLRRRGVEVELRIPVSVEAMRMSAQESAADNDDALFVAGGDGSLHAVLPALMGSNTALAALPGGTANVWVKEAGIPKGFRAAIDAHLTGQAIPIDVGLANGEPFLLMAGIGWDAAIASRVSKPWKRRVGRLAYVAEGLKVLPGLRPAELRWHSGSLTVDAPIGIMVVSNTPLYGGLVRFSPGANASDGLLDLTALSPRKRGDGLALVSKLWRGRLESDGRVFAGQVDELFIETPGVPYQLDGDPTGFTPLRLAVAKRALRMRVPNGFLPAALRAGDQGTE